ncbi:MAG TPA: hypothetical protein PK747_09370 [Acidobacteriota bacterium]|nr:hypothetical protein [Acidobacteriota bacterium]HNT17170.1 hypothetical protein [Acidobacteriota bacterium]HPA27146.1 hypothetical protein [Acidobacteriota bacterium]HQO20779.1 hypothetical protein [Acidobacteriota bacterium]HQQ47602.1 hypothetical protein [Acidobacteriota bacterium]
MSYDPSDEKLESILNDVVTAFDAATPRLKKRVFAGLLDEIALRNAVLGKNGVNMDDLDAEKYKEDCWEEVEGTRAQLAAKLLYSLMSEEIT